MTQAVGRIALSPPHPTTARYPSKYPAPSCGGSRFSFKAPRCSADSGRLHTQCRAAQRPLAVIASHRQLTQIC
jgi:hypothetical protein